MLSLLPFTFAIVAAGSGQAPAEGLLKASMDRYRSMKSFQASYAWSTQHGGEKGTSESRTIAYESPNRFKLVTTVVSGYTMTSICDGKKLLELSTAGNQEYDAPASIASSDSMQMKHPMFCGTLLLTFFGGSSAIDLLVDRAKGAIRFAPDETASGINLRVVKFYATDTFGTTDVGIDPATKLVHFIRYRSEPMVEMMKESTPKASSFLTTERYSGLKVDEDIPDATFEAKAPPGQTVQPMSADGAPPVAIGQPAPDFTVTSMAGKKVKLSSLRGRVVFIDFWATWCPPCRETLPNTQKLYKEQGPKGLAVIAISDEDKKTVAGFLKQNKYTFPAYLDPEATVGEAYKVDGIPTFVVIDAKGRLVDYIVGGGQEARIEAALKKAGVKL